MIGIIFLIGTTMMFQSQYSSVLILYFWEGVILYLIAKDANRTGFLKDYYTDEELKTADLTPIIREWRREYTESMKPIKVPYWFTTVYYPNTYHFNITLRSLRFTSTRSQKSSICRVHQASPRWETSGRGEAKSNRPLIPTWWRCDLLVQCADWRASFPISQPTL